MNEEFPSNEKLERKIKTPEEAAEMTRERRKEAGLPEARGMSAEEGAAIEQSITELRARLYEYDFDGLDPEAQEAWLYAEMEADAGLDRELARANLERVFAALEGKDKQEK